MKTLIRLLIVILVFAFAKESSAQSFRVKAGLNLSNILDKDNDETYSDNYKMNPGFHVGATAEFPIMKMLSFETGLLLSTNGTKYTETEYLDEKIEYKVNCFYLNIPIDAKATFDVGGVKVFGMFGPYLGYGLSGKFKSSVGSTTQTEKVKWGSGDNYDLKHFDFGLTIGTGVEYKSFQAGLFYNLGLANIIAYRENGSEIKNRVLGISLGYKFGGK